MNITYLGHASFLIETNAGTRIVTDPYDPAKYDTLDYKPFDDKADVVTLSHEHNDHAAVHTVKGSPIIIKGYGEFLAKGVEFTGVGLYHDDERGQRRGKNTVFVISADELRIAHMGDLGHVLSSDQAAEIGAVDVVLVPVGGFYTIDAAQAWEVARQLDARIVIPMHYRTEKCRFTIAGVEDFIEGKPNVRREGRSTLAISKHTLPSQQTIVVLEPSQ